MGVLHTVSGLLPHPLLSVATLLTANKSSTKEQPASELLVAMHGHVRSQAAPRSSQHWSRWCSRMCMCGHRQYRGVASTGVAGGHACACVVTGSSRLTSLLGVRLNFQDHAVLSFVSQLQPVKQTCDLRVTVWTDHVEGISRLMGKLSFLEKDQGETEYVYSSNKHTFTRSYSRTDQGRCAVCASAHP